MSGRPCSWDLSYAKSSFLRCAIPRFAVGISSRGTVWATVSKSGAVGAAAGISVAGAVSEGTDGLVLVCKRSTWSILSSTSPTRLNRLHWKRCT
jgi:hypothetical protein